MPLSSKRKQADSLTKLLSINKTIMEMIDPDVTSLVHRKRNSHAHFINLEKSTETSKGAPPRIHPNGGLLAATVTAKSRHKINSLQHQSVYDIQKEDNSTGLRRKDLYDEHINKFMTTKYEREEIIQNYLSNRDTFVK